MNILLPYLVTRAEVDGGMGDAFHDCHPASPSVISDEGLSTTSGEMLDDRDTAGEHDRQGEVDNGEDGESIGKIGVV